ncbi:interleukin-8-like [Pristis pectinata]|uniref:interleukin-8-like n=1 Tax=Pristis pectinata TaxID=685728 RepID=UPI00223DFDF0|nr:interleukin-8-like [Pristis pectinata]
MNSRVMLSILALSLLFAASIQGASIGNTGMNLRCQCIKTSSTFIHPKFMENIEIIPKGPHCETVNIIATLRSGNRVCLNPEADWVKKIINRMINVSKKKPEVQ